MSRDSDSLVIQNVLSLNKLQNFFLSGNFPSSQNERVSYSKIHDQLNHAKSDEIILYHLHAGLEAQNILEKRINDLATLPKLIFFSSMPQMKIPAALSFVVIRPSEWHEFQEKLCDEIYPYPQNKKMIGITGTNGKTSTTYFLHHLLMEQQCKTMLIGTLGLFLNGKVGENFSLTSPGYLLFRKYIYQYQKEFDYCVFEMSSHALDQERFFHVQLDGAGWTSFTQDHLDYHKTMEHYFASKLKILKYLKPDASLFLPASQKEIFKKIPSRQAKLCDVVDFANSNNPMTEIHFMRDNLSVAISLLRDILGRENKILRPVDLNKIPQVPGRMIIKKMPKGGVVTIDYAHTPDALENACKSLKENFLDRKVKVLFGCGGNRDKTKRPLMGAAVSKFADYIYVTSDNPRFEKPEEIIDDIIPGITIPYERDSDREKLLKQALKGLRPNEVLLVAGKGHEDYIQINDVKHPYSDEGVVVSFMNQRNDHG
ncbi:MAG: UDP-N-acetylmuramoyl-L-alanyl-D-glutamate--2,6-diaminopimelate ligase [Bacteriovoracaceae bacterium]|nr:UDP-N-acetylmuramoyl-L-alanyl-D-glutamate--2,6-diaminopimelate ligase [Bacteriovoracaceae bacterium]